MEAILRLAKWALSWEKIKIQQRKHVLTIVEHMLATKGNDKRQKGRFGENKQGLYLCGLRKPSKIWDVKMLASLEFISLLSIGKATVTNDFWISEVYSVSGIFLPSRGVVNCGSVPYIFAFWDWLKEQHIFYDVSFISTERTRKCKST